MASKLVRAQHKVKERVYGQHYTPVDVFEQFIWPYIADDLYKYLWVDLFAGSGNLVVPILERVPGDKREEFFYHHVYMQEVDPRVLDELKFSLKVKFGFSQSLINERVILADSFRQYPAHLKESPYPVFHITNPPYLYLGHIRKGKNKEFSVHLDLFEKDLDLQDLYQVALYNDVRYGVVSRALYIIPTNFLFGDSGSREARGLVLQHFRIERAIFLEKGVFDRTGIHVGLFFFSRKERPNQDLQEFGVRKITYGGAEVNRRYQLNPSNGYRSGETFWEFIKKARASWPLEVRYYLFLKEVKANLGTHRVVLMDANRLERKSGYGKIVLEVNDFLWNKLKANPIYVRTIDTGREDGKAGLYLLHELGVDGIVVTKAPYRTHPIQVFIGRNLTKDQVELLVNYFNLVLNYFRWLEDSEFMTTYKYSESAFYTRKYLGLKLVSSIIETFPTSVLDNKELLHEFRALVQMGEAEAIVEFVKKINASRSLVEQDCPSLRLKNVEQPSLFSFLQ